MDLSIIIPSYNTREILRNSLESIYKTNSEIAFEIIVVDNASEDNSAPMVEKSFPEVVLLKNKKNLGFAIANNIGIKKARGKYLMFLNSDTIVKDSAIEKLVNYLNSHPGIDVVGPKLLNNDGTDQPSAGFSPNLFVVFNMLFLEHFLGGRFVRTSYKEEREVDWLMGAAIMIRKEIINDVGYFDENIFMYYDEVDYCYRIKNKGHKIVYYPDCEIVHLWQKSSQSGREGPILANFSGLLYFFRKHKSTPEIFILRCMLKLKAILSIIIGYATGEEYLVKTYEKAIKLG